MRSSTPALVVIYLGLLCSDVLNRPVLFELQVSQRNRLAGKAVQQRLDRTGRASIAAGIYRGVTSYHWDDVV
jgi:hypothetical protein